MKNQTQPTSASNQTRQKLIETILTPDMLISIRRIILGDKAAGKDLKKDINIRYS